MTTEGLEDMSVMDTVETQEAMTRRTSTMHWLTGEPAGAMEGKMLEVAFMEMVLLTSRSVAFRRLCPTGLSPPIGFCFFGQLTNSEP